MKIAITEIVIGGDQVMEIENMKGTCETYDMQRKGCRSMRQ